MTSPAREVWITGVGLVSCFGEGVERHWEALGSAPSPVVDNDTYAPYPVHPLPTMDWSKQIPRRGDVRQMENWQRLGTYTAGLALEDAGVKDNDEIVSTMDLVVAAGGGERDTAVDDNIMREARARNDRDMLLNERLPYDLRPTLFLAQLSNLMAGNISIVHKVTGSSRTYMGEEAAGITAVENAMRRIQAGQSTHALVGGAFNAERPDMMLSMELGHYAWHGPHKPVLERQGDGGGMVIGSAGVFLVLEEAEFASARGATPYARLASVVSDLGSRDEAATRTRLSGLFDRLGSSLPASVLSGSTGFGPATQIECEVLGERLGRDAAVRFHASMIGNPVEANFPFGIGLAALAIRNGGFYPQFEAAEHAAHDAPDAILVTSVGHYRGEGMGLVERV